MDPLLPPPPQDSDSPAQHARAVVDLVRRGESWPLQRRAAVAWRLRQRIAAQIAGAGSAKTAAAAAAPRRSWRVATAAALFACTTAALAVVLLARAPHDRARASAGALVANGSGNALGPATADNAWSQLSLPDLGFLELSGVDGFEMRELPAERQLRIPTGMLRAQMVRQDPNRPAVVVTSHLRVIVVGTRFDVRVAADRTVVEVLEGKVRVEPVAGGPSALLLAGMSIASDDPMLQPLVPLVPPPTPSLSAPPNAMRADSDAPASTARASAESSSFMSSRSRSERVWMRTAPRAPARVPLAPACDSLPSPADQRRCLEHLAQSTSLSSQNALFTLGVLAREVDQQPDRALRYFRSYAVRFPNGVLGPEAALAALELLGRQGRAAEAIAAAEDFEGRYATDDRVWEVSLVRARLLCFEPARRQEAAQLIEHAAARGPRALRGSVERARRECALAPPPSVAATEDLNDAVLPEAPPGDGEAEAPPDG